MEDLTYTLDSIQGLSRKINKDRTLVIDVEDYMLAILFDGISSAEQAVMGIDIVTKYVEEHHKDFYKEKNFSLSEMMFNAHNTLCQSNLTDPYTTYSAVCILKKDVENSLVWSNMGDSRIYKVDPQYIKQLSEDDNLIHRKDVVTMYLGMVNLNREDFKQTEEIFKERILLCSDGFYSLLEDDLLEFAKILNFKILGTIKNSLHGKIVGNNQDDSSYILISTNV